MAIKATFSPSAHRLSELGDANANTITTSRNAAGQLLVNGGAVTVAGGAATVANTAMIQVFGQAGNDPMIWNPGDGNDLFEGGDGIDTAEVNGGNGSETFTITANGTRVRFDRVTPAPFTLDI